jgi:hypothetical protein
MTMLAPLVDSWQEAARPRPFEPPVIRMVCGTVSKGLAIEGSRVEAYTSSHRQAIRREEGPHSFVRGCEISKTSNGARINKREQDACPGATRYIIIGQGKVASASKVRHPKKCLAATGKALIMSGQILAVSPGVASIRHHYRLHRSINVKKKCIVAVHRAFGKCRVFADVVCGLPQHRKAGEHTTPTTPCYRRSSPTTVHYPHFVLTTVSSSKIVFNVNSGVSFKPRGHFK